MADDGPAIQKIVRLTFLDHPEIEAQCVSSGDEALEIIDDRLPDLVLADVHMPGASGYEVCKRVKELEPSTPVVLLVGNLESFDEVSAEDCGADGSLRKPFEASELLRCLEEAETKARQRFARTAPIPVVAAETNGPDLGARENDMTDELKLSEEQVDQIARRVVELLTDDEVRKIAWEVVPDMAEVVVKERIRELESQVEEL
ncbi:MAG: response regulator [Acidobacteriota bacterium]